MNATMTLPNGGMPQAATGFSHSNEQILRVEDLTVSFDGFKAVDGLSLYVERNELRVIIGPNGAGKTTLLDMICGKTRAERRPRAVQRARPHEA
jgi:urea transport system ATP-binding protein